jgi:hypothetical protein
MCEQRPDAWLMEPDRAFRRYLPRNGKRGAKAWLKPDPSQQSSRNRAEVSFRI